MCAGSDRAAAPRMRRCACVRAVAARCCTALNGSNLCQKTGNLKAKTYSEPILKARDEWGRQVSHILQSHASWRQAHPNGWTGSIQKGARHEAPGSAAPGQQKSSGMKGDVNRTPARPHTARALPRERLPARHTALQRGLLRRPSSGTCHGGRRARGLVGSWPTPA